MDVMISFIVAGRREQEGSNVRLVLHNVKSPEQVQQWAAKKIAVHVPVDVAQTNLIEPSKKKESKKERRLREES